jgi:hypothetical protein
MVGEARRRNPGLEFREGDMLALDLAPDSLVGIVCRSPDAAGFTVEDIAEREPYPEVEYRSRRAYIFGRKRALSR